MRKILVWCFFATLFWAGSALGHDHHPNTNVLFRVFAILTTSGSATAFAIDVDDRQYLITAAHAVRDTAKTQVIALLHDSTWLPMNVQVVANEINGSDIAVLAPDVQLSPSFALPATKAGMTLSQDAFFLGFPAVVPKSMDNSAINRGFPLPFIKKGIISAMGKDKNGNRLFYLDAHNNFGFSGGPVVYWNYDSSMFCVLGVVSSFQPEVLTKPDTSSAKGWSVVEDLWGNSGVLVCSDISLAIDAIRANPIGAEIQY